MLNSFFFSAKAGDIGEAASKPAARAAVSSFREVCISSPLIGLTTADWQIDPRACQTRPLRSPGLLSRRAPRAHTAPRAATLGPAFPDKGIGTLAANSDGIKAIAVPAQICLFSVRLDTQCPW